MRVTVDFPHLASSVSGSAITGTPTRLLITIDPAFL